MASHANTMEDTVNRRRVNVRRGRHVGWWVEGRWANGHLFMMTWWPTQGLARMVARLVGGSAYRSAAPS